ncbi:MULTISPECIES: type II toxin-antitoxin system YafO family toxin [Pantoea]|jgi:mRNA interferase YafO|uniref:type II toxin-antitoxin system YafO family toxin n=1 Tax=Pantoea TaxID=53335 RepID=UPI000EA3BDE4|nr:MULTISPECIES: type II toxin-antitoxin system YafO family toxin [Pantoea]MBZ6385538.1 type II toxin-antitoxin system YafO family toxin [Pantoea piersonii]MBZ6398918.1 type II toxin-antitoxin system YafO family toxin [Pantoea piersonii]MBZ6407584.1 type II toxin-antitoxin system YafO family toxin [Pantoea piersonii]MBZ6425465.1 type II toxin-antitoxin system YafO family toxin [Pantoea piersonii]NYB01012.1 type II toxin-antitoxin system YafO family toxin [Pantoea piersonii]
MVKVSIAQGLSKSGVAHRYAQNLAEHISLGRQFWCFGSHGGFERNYEAMSANIRKIHLLIDGDKPWHPDAPLSERTSNNYLVYAKHFYREEHLQLLAIISPNAHQVIDDLLPGLVDLAEQFIELSDEELALLKTYQA